MMNKILLDCNLIQLQQIFCDLPKYRSKQIFSNLQKYIPFSEMTDLPQSLREKLQQDYCDLPLKFTKLFESSDGTQKFLLKTLDDDFCECVLLKQSYGNTLCISTQLGCKMNCSFCASCKKGFFRNLTAGEILSQVLLCESYLQKNLSEKTNEYHRQITNLVLMGMGEPFDNYDNVMDFLRLVTSKDSLNISPRNISLSTCGLVDKINLFCEENIPVNLCLSMHSPFDEKRKTIMPISNRYTVEKCVSAMNNYFEKTGRRFIIEYAVIDGFNNSKEDAQKLLGLLKGKVCHINLIALNDINGGGKPNRTCADKFCKTLCDLGLSCTVRISGGADIEAACGQLRKKELEKDN